MDIKLNLKTEEDTLVLITEGNRRSLTESKIDICIRIGKKMGEQQAHPDPLDFMLYIFYFNYMWDVIQKHLGVFYMLIHIDVMLVIFA